MENGQAIASSRVEAKWLKLIWAGVVLLLGGTIWFLDFITGPDLSFSIFYLVPICLAVWQLGFLAGLVMAVVSAVMWVMADYASHQPYGHSVVLYWNGLVRLEFFVLMVMLVHNIRHLNQALRNRTASLIVEIGERRRAEEALAESQKIFRLITENAADLIAVLNLEGEVRYTSPSCQSVLGQTEGLQGKRFFDQVVPEDREPLREAFQRALKTGASQRADYRVLRSSSPVYLESEWSLVREGQGEPLNVVVVSRDVTARKRMEQLFANEKDILEMIAERKSLPEVLHKTIQKIEGWSGRMHCSIRVFDADGKAILHEASETLEALPAAEPTGPFAPTGPAIPAIPALESLGTLAAPAGLRLRQQKALPPGLELAFDKPVLSASGEVLGHLAIYVRNGHDPELARLQLFERIAHVTAIALERQRSEDSLRRLSSQILNAQEAERRRLASELHDSVSQMLASVSFRVHSIITQIPRESVALRQEVAKARFLLRKVMHEVRSISENLRPSELDDLGLVAAVRSLCEDFNERNQIAVEFTTPPRPERFSNEIELALYRIVQEGLANVEKHAQAKQVSLALQWDDQFVTLKLHDNGKGITAASVASNGLRKRHGMGLVDMRERCAFLGGTFSILSEPQKGTELAARIPRKIANGNGVTE